MEPKARVLSFHPADLEPRTIERQKFGSEHPTTKMPTAISPTRKMDRIDPELLEMARGDASEANDTGEHPFGGLVPVRDDDQTDWSVVNAKVVADLEQIIGTALGPLASLLLVRLDGTVGLHELSDMAGVSEDDVMMALDELEWSGIVAPKL